MRKFSKILALVVAVVFVIGSMAACVSTNSPNKGTGDTPKTSTDSPKTSTEPPKEEKRIKMTLFMGNSGLQAPDGVDVSDNKFINIIEDYANVDLEVEVPIYADYNTKFNLLLASNQLPDIVHAQSAGEALKRGDEGAFLDLYNYWKNSPVIQKYINETKMEIAKSDNGGYYRIPMKYDNSPEGRGIIGRYDLIAKYNNNKWPETVEDWLDIARKLKADDPNAIPFSLRTNNGKFKMYGGGVIPALYGAADDRWDYEESKLIAQIALPEYKAALETMAQMYKEGTLDPEFATHDAPTYFAKIVNNSVLADFNEMNQTLPGGHAIYRNSTELPEQNTWEKLVAPPLKTYPSILKDVKYTQSFKGTGITGHGMFISSKCKEPDRAWKVIEGFACDELYERLFWGWEGETYKVENGKRIPDSKALADLSIHRYGVAYATIFGFNNAQEVANAGAVVSLGQDYFDKIQSHMSVIDKQAMSNGVSPVAYLKRSDDANKKLAESNDEVFAISTEYVMGKITSDQFDKRASDWIKNYGFIFEEATKYINDNKAELKTKGVRFDR